MKESDPWWLCVVYKHNFGQVILQLQVTCFHLDSAGRGQKMLFLTNSAQFQASAVLPGVTVLGQVAMGKE